MVEGSSLQTAVQAAGSVKLNGGSLCNGPNGRKREIRQLEAEENNLHHQCLHRIPPVSHGEKSRTTLEY